jgi:hypothetical protein
LGPTVRGYNKIDWKARDAAVAEGHASSNGSGDHRCALFGGEESDKDN